MSPLRWIQSTGPHWTVMLEEVTSDTLTEVGGVNGAGGIAIGHRWMARMPASRNTFSKPPHSQTKAFYIASCTPGPLL